jgi:hypothetical protein
MRLRALCGRFGTAAAAGLDTADAEWGSAADE